VLHCSESAWGDRDIIRLWHLDRGFRDIGYNGVILNGVSRPGGQYDNELDGLFQQGRALDFDEYVDDDEKAAHVLGYNDVSVGVCMIGIDKFSVKQMRTALVTSRMFTFLSPDIKIVGHYEMSTASGKTCPNIDMDVFRRVVMSEDYTCKNIMSNCGRSLRSIV